MKVIPRTGAWTAVNHPNDDFIGASSLSFQDYHNVMLIKYEQSNSFEPVEKSLEAPRSQETLKALSQFSPISTENASLDESSRLLDAAKKDRKLHADYKASLAGDAEHKWEEVSHECEKQRNAILDTQLNETKEELEVRNALYTQMVSQVEPLLVLPVIALQKLEEAQNKQSVLIERHSSIFDWGSLVRTVKRFSGEVQDTNHASEERLKKLRVTLKRMVDTADALRSQFVAT